MNSVGEVIELKDEIALIKFKRGKACKNCNACISFSSDELIVEINNSLDAKVGDRVNIILHPKSVLKASLIAYGLPLLALILGAVIGSQFGDLYTAILGILGAGAAFFTLRMLEPRFERMSDFQPKMISFASDDENESETQ